MFTSKSKENSSVPESSAPAKVGASIIASGTVIKGDIECSGDIRIDGTLKGNVHATNKVFIGTEGLVEGDIHCVNADILGKVQGKVTVKDLLNIRGKAHVKGDLFTGKLQVEPSASFNGNCHMAGSTTVAALPGASAVKVGEDEPEYAEAE
ncbi:bactofilin family protein [Dinghuibacter silviterrae]|uniref:Cytoskeletal protein CcmA (Bactofilin family) n=1 Tax=Dinghuibacter silviterrae TaxID=1539049 RepID=A0A4R8DS10_9BACT|nr:polymer-forming cytoskeletal protein [Dinghuibacter silviterrae]TDX01024.1 cytoskeletal protein CcmA (bactofilin family) [Dinghuibacter silviterrae]